MTAATVVCTLGMHRSGTSLVARMLNLLGVALGPDERVLTSGADNPRGYWEHRSFVDLNDEILARFGARWDETPAFPLSWPRDPRLDDLRERAQAVLRRDFADAPLWGWKDPRTCLTLPFWQDLVGPMRYVICLRNPCAVAASLDRRNGMPFPDAERLWLAHVQDSLRHTSGGTRLFVFYEDILQDWPAELRRLATFIGNPARAADSRVREAVAAFLEDDMCHHRLSVEDLAGDPRISFPTLGLYLALRGHAGPEDLQRTLDLAGARALETWQRTVTLTAEREGLARGNEALAAEREALARDAQAQASTIAGLSAERDALALREQRLLLREERSRASIVSLGSALRAMTVERDAEVRRSATALKELDEIHTSSTWRLASFLGNLLVGLLPAGTRRRRLFNVLF